jgi:hypothetical protein
MQESTKPFNDTYRNPCIPGLQAEESSHSDGKLPMLHIPDHIRTTKARLCRESFDSSLSFEIELQSSHRLDSCSFDTETEGSEGYAR